jgi:uncharacterized protein YbcI
MMSLGSPVRQGRRVRVQRVWRTRSRVFGPESPVAGPPLAQMEGLHENPRRNRSRHFQGIGRFEQEFMGRGPKNIQTHLIGDLLVVRLQGVLTAAEQHLVKSLPGEKGRDLLKQVRTQLIETARPMIEAMVQEITGVSVSSLHHDVSTLSGEEVVIFSLTDSPLTRATKKQ